MSKEVSKEVE